MEKKLKALFEYQRFEGNPRLERLIAETEGYYAKQLTDEELGLVNAAGEIGNCIGSGGGGSGEGAGADQMVKQLKK